MKGQTATCSLRLPASLKTALVQISKDDGTSINQFVATAVAEKICAMKTTEFFASRAADADVRAALSILNREGGQTPEPCDRMESHRQAKGDVK